MRPARPLSPIPIAVGVLFIWWVVARNSGSGWVQALGDAVFGLVSIGLFGPAVALARIRIDPVQVPQDGAAGSPVVAHVAVSGRARVRPIEPPGPEALVGPTRDRPDDVTLLPARRGCHERLELEVATAAPFGLQWWCRRITLSLPAPLHVAPRMGSPMPLPNWIDDRDGRSGTPSPAEAGDARGVREYLPGDRRKRVHWASTAHTGRLMVREMEAPSSLPVTLKVSLPREPEAAELTAERALGTVVGLVDRGATVVLATTETTGEIVSPVADRREAGRRLARATDGDGSGRLELLRDGL